jgi:hypothetical protein
MGTKTPRTNFLQGIRCRRSMFAVAQSEPLDKAE